METVKTNKETLQSLYNKMLAEYSGGISNTSTKKFDSIKEFFAKLLEIPTTEVYATAAGARPSNLEVRLTQGLQAIKHTTFGIGFLQTHSIHRANQLADSALVTIQKFLGRKKATYDGVGVIVAVNKELHFLRLLELPNSKIGKNLKDHFPELRIRTLSEDQTVLSTEQGRLFDPNAKKDEFEDKLFERVVNLLDDGFAGVIFTGAPGTSKSYYAARIAARLAEFDSERVRFVQFHPSYQYEDFVEGFVPEEDGTFHLKGKHLLKMCEVAEENEGYCIIVIDELSRCDPARVFGEALTYIEMTKRNQIFYRASGNETLIPDNLIVLATMNPMDRGVDEVDAALERRFAKIPMNPDIGLLKKMLADNDLDEGLSEKVIEFFNYLLKNKNSSAHVGHAYFHRIKDMDSLKRLWDSQLKFHFEKAFRLDPEGLIAVEKRWERIFTELEEKQTVEPIPEVIEINPTS